MKEFAEPCNRCHSPLPIRLISWFYQGGDACKKCMGFKEEK